MKRTFIQITEIWTPSPDRSLLEFAGGLFGDHLVFRLATHKLCFGYDQGLPGKAWAERRPIILTDLQNTPWFKRGEAAKKAGLSCGVAIPVFAGDYLLAVVVFFCGDDEDHVGAIELWHNEAAKSAEMKLAEGYFGILESFRFTSSHTSFMRGFGLPGEVWESGLPALQSDLGHAERFLRRDDARRVGINKGLGLPSPYAPGHQYVMTFLSALGTPIARRIEVWVPDAAREGLVLKEGQCDRDGGFVARYRDVVLECGHGLIGTVWATGLPALSEHIDSEKSPVGSAAAAADLNEVVALPILEAGRLAAIVAMYF